MKFMKNKDASVASVSLWCDREPAISLPLSLRACARS